MQLSKAIDEAHLFSEQLYRRRVRNDLRSRVSVACFGIAQQHHNAILLQLAQSPPLEASSFALLRPLIEAVIRGLWLCHVATDAEVEKYVSEGTKLTMARMMKRLDQVTELDSYKGLYQQNWSVLCAYTHTGELQVQRWLTTSHIEPVYSEQAVAELIEMSSFVARLAFQTVVESSLDPENGR